MGQASRAAYQHPWLRPIQITGRYVHRVSESNSARNWANSTARRGRREGEPGRSLCRRCARPLRDRPDDCSRRMRSSRRRPSLRRTGRPSLGGSASEQPVRARQIRTPTFWESIRPDALPRVRRHQCLGASASFHASSQVRYATAGSAMHRALHTQIVNSRQSSRLPLVRGSRCPSRGRWPSLGAQRRNRACWSTRLPPARSCLCRPEAFREPRGVSASRAIDQCDHRRPPRVLACLLR
jgi:hypothetical protein